MALTGPEYQLVLCVKQESDREQVTSFYKALLLSRDGLKCGEVETRMFGVNCEQGGCCYYIPG
jgi:hypothetical protein